MEGGLLSWYTYKCISHVKTVKNCKNRKYFKIHFLTQKESKIGQVWIKHCNQWPSLLRFTYYEIYLLDEKIKNQKENWTSNIFRKKVFNFIYSVNTGKKPISFMFKKNMSRQFFLNLKSPPSWLPLTGSLASIKRVLRKEKYKWPTMRQIIF